ncbi:MAG: type VI secretion system-associated FHA domain protein TagH [Litoreibacter sp.]
MTLTLVLENAATPQRETSRSYDGGQFMIGRSPDADWVIDDPNMYVSRKHCIISDESGTITVIDASSDGLFVDGSQHPLGSGNSVPLEDQMRLRMGEYVIRVEMQLADTPAEKPKAKSPFNFDPQTTPFDEPQPRPEELPPKFKTKKRDPFGVEEDSAPPSRKNTFELDLKRPTNGPPEFRQPLGIGDFFKRSEQVEIEIEELNSSEPYPPIEINRDAGNAGPAQDDTPTIQAKRSGPELPQKVSMANSDNDMVEALIRGLGVSPQALQDLSLDEVEAIGARFRDMVDGLMFLLRTRSQERQKVRVAQTLIAKSGVNPLKFIPNTNAAITALIQGNGTSYLSGDKAVPDAFRDLADHQVRTWSALQTALRSMIDKFNPDEIEREMADTGLLEQLVAGGRNAKMWQLYQERYRDIAASAEERFLGEVGSDFRDAYEETERT